jgi:CHAT domain
MKGADEILLSDARESILKKLAGLVGQKGLDEAFAAWLLPEEEIGLDLENAALDAVGRIGAARTYQDVATLGFAADAGKINGGPDVLRDDLEWLAGTSPFINNTPAGVSVDPVALLGITVGAKALGDPNTLKNVRDWISSFISTSYEMRNAELWHKCLFATAQRVVEATPELEIPEERSVADVRVALVNKGLLSLAPDKKTEDERQCLILIKSGNVLPYDVGRLALSLAAYNAISSYAPALLAESSDSETSLNRESKMVKILFLASNPTDQNPLQLTREMKEIDRDVHQAEFRERFKFEQQWEVSVKELQGHLMRYKPDIVHFSGHGSSASEIILQDNSGNSHPVPVRALSNLFSALKDNIRCVVLNACFSEKQAEAIAEHIECVVGMTTAISDAAAISFAAKFYQALAYGKSVQDAFKLGCVQTDMEGLDEQDTPKLLHAPHCDPSNVLFVTK